MKIIFNLLLAYVIALPAIAQNGSSNPDITSFEYPVEDCFTYTYRLQVGDGGMKTVVKKLLTAFNGELYNVGYVEDASGNRKGLLQQIDHQANIAWTKYFSFPDRSVWYNNIQQLPDGRLLLSGASSTHSTGEKNALFTCVNEDGQLQWNKTVLRNGYEAMATTMDSVASLPSGIGFAAQNGNSLLFGQIFNDGSLGWVKECSPLGQGRIVGMGARANFNWYIAYQTTDPGGDAGIVLRINPVTGNITQKQQFGGAASGKQYIFRDANFYNASFKIVSLVKEGNGPYKICMLDLLDSGGSLNNLLFEVTGVVLENTANVVFDKQYKVIAFTKSQNSSDVYLARIGAQTLPGIPLRWIKKYNLPANFENLAIERSFDAGFVLSAQSHANNGEQFTELLKTDSTGSVKNCEGTSLSVAAVFEGHTAAVPGFIANSISVNAQAETPTLLAQSINHVFSCKSLNCPILPVEDTCMSSFTRRYNSADFGHYSFGIMGFQNRVFLAGHNYVLERTGADQSIQTLSSINPTGKIIDRRQVKLGKGGSFRKLATTPDGNFLTLGHAYFKSDYSLNDTSYFTLAKFSPGLQLLWNTAIPQYQPQSTSPIFAVDADGNIFLFFLEGTNILSGKAKLFKFNGNGQFIWAKSYVVPNSCMLGYSGSVVMDGEYLYIMHYATCGPGNFFMKINKQTGAPVLVKGFKVDAVGGNQFQAGLNMDIMGEKLVLHGRVEATGAATNIVYMLDKTGNLLQSKAFQTPTHSGEFKQKLLSNGEIVLVAGSYEGCFYLRLDSNLNILRARQTPFGYISIYDIEEDINGSVLATGLEFFYYENTWVPFVSKFDYDGRIGSCASDSLQITQVVQNILITNTSAAVADLANIARPLPVNVSSFSLQNAGLACAQVSTCSSIQLTAPIAICDTLPHVATVQRNAGCTIPVNFSFNNPALVVLEQTDTSIRFKIMQPGLTQLVGSMFTGCIWLRDTVVISSTSTQFSLGNDTSICENSNLLLDAGPGFSSYLWNDGSTQSNLSINNEGIYWVQVTDGCNNTLRDSITISWLQKPAINIGNDTSTCNAATITLTAPAGYVSYQWLPAYQLNPLWPHQINVSPQVDTAYAVRVEYAPNCFVWDTLQVRVHYSAPIYLGADSSFCQGQSIVLDAGNGFQSYSWNTGASSQAILVNQAGAYIVTATDANGCQSKDSLMVNDVYPLPTVQLGPDFSMCTGTTKLLNAGSYTAYLWNNGSSNSTLEVQSPGLYHVTVTDNRGCVGKDSITLISNWPLPADFLPGDTAICNYGNIVIQPKRGFASYLWNTGSNSSQLNVQTPGVYWLTVKDQNGCEGSDSMRVNSKECMQGIYVPNAFTPNNDGNNDIFRPMIFGDLQQYQLQVYNRYGQIVFETTEPLRGWDGNFAGTQQNSGAFVWICRYQLRNQSIEVAKGTVLLLR